MTIYIQGQYGLIGSNLVKLGAKEYDGIRFPPPVIINCIGFTDVDGCETNPLDSYKSNVEVPMSIVKWRGESPYCIHLSSDFIFSGLMGPYREDAQPAPLSVYGAQKWIAETLIQTLPKHLIVRTTCVYGWHPKKRTFAHWVKEQCEKGQPFRVTQVQVTTPTYAPDLARIMLNLIEQDAHGIVNVAGPELMDRWWFAREIAEAFGYDPDLVKATGRIEQKARRPLNGGLLVNKLRETYGIEPQPMAESLKEMVKEWVA